MQILFGCFPQIKIAGTHALFAAVTEISDSILKGAEASGFNGMVSFSSTSNSCLPGDLEVYLFQWEYILISSTWTINFI